MRFALGNLAVALWRALLSHRGQQGAGGLRRAVLIEFLRRLMHLASTADPARVRAFEQPMPVGLVLGWRSRERAIRVAGVPTFEVVPARGETRGTVLYLHGGGYNFCSPATHRGLLVRLAVWGRRRVVAPDYRLAPEHPFPAAIDDALAVYRRLLAEGTDPQRLVLGGDSAGGGLALATMLRLREAGEPLPRQALLLSPWVDLSLSGESIEHNAPSDYLSRDVLRCFAKRYLAGQTASMPLASPLFAELEGLPPLLIQVGAAETLRSEGEALAVRARQAGVEVTFQEWEGAMHAFQVMAPIVPEAAAALRSIVAYLEAPAKAVPAADDAGPGK